MLLTRHSERSEESAFALAQKQIPRVGSGPALGLTAYGRQQWDAALVAAVELESDDLGSPVGVGAGALEVLVGVPHGAVVRGIDAHAGVVAPAIDGLLRPFADIELGLQLHPALGGRLAGDGEIGEHGGARNAVTEAQIALLILGDAAHPAVKAVVGAKRSVVRHGPTAASARQLIPALARLAAGRAVLHGVGDHH